MDPSFEQRVRHAVVSHEARRYGRPASLDDVAAALAPAPRAQVEAMLLRLEAEGLLRQDAGGWRARSPPPIYRAVPAYAPNASMRIWR